MKEINLNKKYKVIQLFLSGYTYDEIALELGIAKGSVVNIIDAFRNGELQIAPNEYIDALRELAVDLRKQHITVKQLKMYDKIYQKLTDMGVGMEQIDDWLDISQDIFTESISAKQFVAAALHLAQLEADTGYNPKTLVAEFKGKSEALKQLKAEVAQTTKSKSKLDQYVAEAELNWDLVATVKAILHDKLTKQGLGGEEIGKISKRIAEIGSLVSSIKGLANEKKTIEEKIIMLKEDAHNMEVASIGIKKQTDLEASQAYAMMEAKKALEVQMKEIEWQLKELKKVKAGHALDIYTSWLMVAFLKDPGKIDNGDFDWLVEMLNGISLARLGKGPKQVVDAEGKVICQCHVPMPYTPIKDYGVAMDKARERLAEYLVPLVEDKFVSKFEYDTSKTMQEITEMNKKLYSAMSGHPEVLDQPTNKSGASGQKKTPEETNPNEQPDEALNAETIIPEQPTVPEGNLYYSPGAVKARWKADEEFKTKMGSRICNAPYPWEDDQ